MDLEFIGSSKNKARAKVIVISFTSKRNRNCYIETFRIPSGKSFNICTGVEWDSIR